MKKRIIPLLVLSSMISPAMFSCQKGGPNSSITQSEAEVHYTGQGAPDNSLGKNGDTYTDTLTNETYTKNNGVWTKDNNSHTFTGVGVPNQDMGKDGDTYTDTSTGDIYTKQNGYWVKTHEGNEGEKFLVTFDLNGGTLPDGSTSIPSQEVLMGRWVEEPKVNPSKPNSTFLGWYSGNSDTKWVFTNGVYGDLVLKAHYAVNEEDKIVVTIDPNNGEAVYTVETFIGDYLRLSIPQKEGYNFIGWYIDNGEEKFTGYVDDSLRGKTLVARFEKSKFNLYYRVEDNGEITITGIRDIESVTISIPESLDGRRVTGISSTAFNNRISLVSITIPSTVSRIEAGAFRGARALQTIIVDDTNPYITAVDGILFSKDMTELLLCPPKNRTSYTVPSSVRKIGDYSFYDHKDSGISSISFSEGLEEIGEYAFYQNFSISTLTFPSTLKKIGKGAFDCVSASYGGVIQTVNFNEGLEEIGAYAFVGAYFKEVLTLPSTVKVIGDYAFANCTAITKFVFPKSLETLGANAFAGATGILNIDIATGNTHFKVFKNVLYDFDMTKVIMCPSGKTDETEIPEGVTEIGDYAFYMVDECQSYIFPSSLRKIGKQAFAHCYGLRSFTMPDSVTEIGENCFDLCEKMTSITLSKGLSIIPKEAFIECTSLKKVIIPGNVKTIDKGAFSGCSNLSEVVFNEGLEKIETGAFYYYQDSEFSYSSPSGLTAISLPNSLLSIGDNAFANQSTLTSVVFGNGLISVGQNAFYGCNLLNMSVSSDNENLVVDNLVLYTKNKDTAIFASTNISGALNLPSTVKYIKPFAFYECTKITSVTFSNVLEEIGEGAFKGLFGPQKSGSLHFPASLKTIGDGAFSSTAADDITFNEGLLSIGENAFSWANESSLVLPNSLQHIGYQAFILNSNLTSLTLGTGLVSIGGEAFSRCMKLEGNINLGPALETFAPAAFVNCTSLNNYVVSESNPYFTCSKGLLMNKNQTEVVAYAPNYRIGSVLQVRVNVPDTVKVIRDYGFTSAINLTVVSLPSGLESIGEEAFTNDSAIASMIVPQSVNYIGKNAFNYWRSSQKIYFYCSEEEAMKSFSPYYLSGCNAVVSYEYVG